jgi:hypothetical protein
VLREESKVYLLVLRQSWKYSNARDYGDRMKQNIPPSLVYYGYYRTLISEGILVPLQASIKVLLFNILHLPGLENFSEKQPLRHLIDQHLPT